MYLTPYVPSVTPPDPPDSDRVISGSPEGVVTASVGAQRLDGDTNTLYYKETGDNTNTGWVSVSGGGGGISGLTTGTIPKAASSTSLTDSPITVVGNDITVAGNITAGGSAAGQVVLGDGGANTITLKTQTISSNINWIFPAAPATGFLLGTNSAGDVTLSHVDSLGTGNVVRASQIDDTVYGAGWNGVTDKAPSQNAVYDKIESLSLGGGTPGGADTNVQFNDGGAFGGEAAFSYNKTTDIFSLIGSPGANTAPTLGFEAKNSTAASAGNQQFSPALFFESQGWKTVATAASQPVRFRAYLDAVQGGSAPTGSLIFQSSINGGGFSNSISLSSGGLLTAQSVTTASGNVTAAAAAFFAINTRSKIGSSADGALEALNNAGTAISSLQAAAAPSTKTSNYPVVALDVGKSFNINGATSKIVFTLPAAVLGMRFTFNVTDTDGMDITSVGDDVIQFGASVTAAAGTITSTTKGSSITLEATDAATWFAVSLVGTWA